MLRFENVATPPAAATVVVPASTPPDGFAAIAIVTFPVNEVTALPKASRAETRTAGAIDVPAIAVEGCTVNASAVVAPALMVKAVLVVPVRAPDDAARV